MATQSNFKPFSIKYFYLKLFIVFNIIYITVSLTGAFVEDISFLEAAKIAEQGYFLMLLALGIVFMGDKIFKPFKIES